MVLWEIHGNYLHILAHMFRRSTINLFINIVFHEALCVGTVMENTILIEKKILIVTY